MLLGDSQWDTHHDDGRDSKTEEVGRKCKSSYDSRGEVMYGK